MPSTGLFFIVSVALAPHCREETDGEQPGAGTLISGAADTSSIVLHLFPRCCVRSSRSRNAAEPFESGGKETAVKPAGAPG